MIQTFMQCSRAYWHQTHTAQRILFITGTGLFFWMVAHIIALLVTDTPLHGPVSYRKAATFAETGWLMCWAVGYVLPDLNLKRVGLWSIVGGTLAFGAGETLLMSVQVWRGEPSHYNFTTPINTALFSTTGVIALLWLLAMFVLLAAVARPNALSPSMRLSYLVGTLLYIFGGITGFLMMLNLGGLYQGDLLQNAQSMFMGEMLGSFTGPAPDESGGNLVVLHAFGVHGLSLVPLVPWLLGYTSMPERRRVQWTALVSLGVVGVIVALGVQAITQQPLAAIGPVTGLVIGVGSLTSIVGYLLASLSAWRAVLAQ